MAQELRKPVIVTFRRKDQRQNQDRERDKLTAFQDLIGRTDVSFYSAESLSRGVMVPSAQPLELMGYDVNRYEAPIVMAT